MATFLPSFRWRDGGGEGDCVRCRVSSYEGQGPEVSSFDHQSLFPSSAFVLSKQPQAVSPVLLEPRNPVMSSVDLQQEFVEPCYG